MPSGAAGAGRRDGNGDVEHRCPHPVAGTGERGRGRGGHLSGPPSGCSTRARRPRSMRREGRAGPRSAARFALTARFGSDVIRSMTTPWSARARFTLSAGTLDKAIAERSVQLVTVAGEPGVGKSPPRGGAVRVHRRDWTSSSPGARAAACPTGKGSRSGRWARSSRRTRASSSPTPPTRRPRSWTRCCPSRTTGPGCGRGCCRCSGSTRSKPPAQEELFTAWRRFLESVAERAPLVLVVEDIHWADPALLAFLEHLADWARASRCSSSAPRGPSCTRGIAAWGTGLRNQTAINLSPLSETETAKLVSALLEQTVLPAETQQLLLERAGGNPLYAEEFVAHAARPRPARRAQRPQDGHGCAVPGIDPRADRGPPRHAPSGTEDLAPGRGGAGQGLLGRRHRRDGRPRSARGRAGAARALAARSWFGPPASRRWRAKRSMGSGTCWSGTSSTSRSRARRVPAKHLAAADWLEAKAGEPRRSTTCSPTTPAKPSSSHGQQPMPPSWPR